MNTDAHREEKAGKKRGQQVQEPPVLCSSALF
jgi:hypothetical protein